MSTQEQVLNHLIPILLDDTIEDSRRAQDIIVCRMKSLYGTEVTLSQMEWKPYKRSVTLYVTDLDNVTHIVSHQEILNENEYIGSVIDALVTRDKKLQITALVLVVATLVLVCALFI